jgi:hypothetical protein
VLPHLPLTSEFQLPANFVPFTRKPPPWPFSFPSFEIAVANMQAGPSGALPFTLTVIMSPNSMPPQRFDL